MKRIVPYNPSWSALYLAETKALSEKLGAVLIASHHIGSTAIPDIPAKPVIDILLEVTSVSALDNRADAMASIGYDVRGEYGIPKRRYFSKPATETNLAYHVHAYKAGSYQVQRHLSFRDYLRSKPGIAAEYASIKRNLSDRNGILFADYQASKKDWVDAISLKAMQFYSSTT